MVNCEHDTEAYLDAMNEFESLWNQTYELSQDKIKEYSTKLSFAIEHWDMIMIWRILKSNLIICSAKHLGN